MSFDDEDMYLINNVQNNTQYSGNFIKNLKNKKPLNGAAQLTVSRRQTSDGHDHGYIKSKERNNSIWKLINAQFVAIQILIQLDT
ncbi:MAG: hypothetical protein IJP60_00685 [Bacilli bacterium]|nr:hypothetical protein [Bacilli bacterium]